MRFAARVVILLLVAATAAAVGNAVRPGRLRWVVSRQDVYPPPTPAEVGAAILREEVAAVMGHGAILIDARAEEKYCNGHIPTAHNLPAESAQANLAKVFSWAQPADVVIVYCGGAECDESRQVFDLLKANGFTHVRLYFGGWEDWTKANMPVEESSE